MNSQRKTSGFSGSIVVTGGAGFVGANLLNYLVPKEPETRFVNIDCLTYAANLANLAGIENAPNYCFERVDICDREKLHQCLERHRPDGIIHLAAETHVDRSITGPSDFVRTNVMGTFNLLEYVRERAEQGNSIRFLHVSTDEVYGSLGESGFFTEDSPYRPSSPYSASKAAADHLVHSCHVTYGLDCLITNCGNNYGRYQYAEKLIPLMIANCLEGKPLPVYGDGSNRRDWLHVLDHCAALDLVFHKGEAGSRYNIGGRNEVSNIDLVRRICGLVDKVTGQGEHEKLITFVKDRPGHDQRYAVDPSLIEKELGWKPRQPFEDGLRETVEWYTKDAPRAASEARERR